MRHQGCDWRSAVYCAAAVTKRSHGALPKPPICGQIGDIMSKPDAAQQQLHPQTQVLLAILANQVARTEACLEGLTQANLDVVPGGDCQSIRGIVGHLLGLRGFQLSLLQSPLQGQMPKLSPSASLEEMSQVLGQAAELVRTAVTSHDPADWFAEPREARPGPWGNEPTLIRVSRPLNDFTNHLGAIRAIRRMLGNPAARTQ